MSIFKTKKATKAPTELSEALDSIENEEKAREAERRARGVKFTRLNADTVAEASEHHEAFVAAVLLAAASLEKRDAILGRLVGVRAELEALGAPAPEPDLRFSPEALKAAASLLPVLHETLASAPSALTHPALFRY